MARRMNRRHFLTTTAAGVVAGSIPATAAAMVSDPLLNLIREYQRQMEIYNAAGGLSDEENEVLAAATWNAPYDRLCEAPPEPTTDAGALAAVQFIATEVEGCGYQPDLFVNVLNATAAYLQGRMA